jgi:hypothetical protein
VGAGCEALEQLAEVEDPHGGSMFTHSRGLETGSTANVWAANPLRCGFNSDNEGAGRFSSRCCREKRMATQLDSSAETTLTGMRSSSLNRKEVCCSFARLPRILQPKSMLADHREPSAPPAQFDSQAGWQVGGQCSALGVEIAIAGLAAHQESPACTDL